jgi:enolase
MTPRIDAVHAREVLDSRGRPTVEAQVRLSDGTSAHASVPAGASKGRHEAVELRDGDAARYRALGVLKAVSNVERLIAPALHGHDAADQAGVDAAMCALDGTADKSRLGANAILAVSLAVARAAATAMGMPLWRYLGQDAGRVLPLPMVNIISGGLHARGNLDFQDFLVVPVGAESYSGALETCGAIYASTEDLLGELGHSTLKADEGGFGPALEGTVATFEILCRAIEAAGYRPGEDVAFAIDVAASHLHVLDGGHGHYRLASEGRDCRSEELVEVLAELVARYPIVSIEDGLAEDDWEGWQRLTARIGDRVQLIGDDLFATNLERVERGIASGAANAVLVKMNQIGTLTETMTVVQRAREAGMRTILSARSGDTEDAALADIAVATNAGQIKVGSLAQSERLAKYNQLLRIEEELGAAGRYAGRDALRLADATDSPVA